MPSHALRSTLSDTLLTRLFALQSHLHRLSWPASRMVTLYYVSGGPAASC